MTELEDAIHADIDWALASGAEDLGDWFDWLYQTDPSDFDNQLVSVGEEQELDNATMHRVGLIIALARFGPASPHTLLQWVKTILGVGEAEGERGGAPEHAGDEEFDHDCAYTHLQNAVRLMEGIYAPVTCSLAWLTLASWEPGLAEAARLFRRAVDSARTDPAYPQPQPGTLLSAAIVVASTHDLSWAQEALAQARNLVTTPGSAPEVKYAIQLAEPSILFAAEAWAEAEGAAEKVRQAFRRKPGPWDPMTLKALEIQAMSMIGLSRANEAKRLLDPILAEHRKSRDAPVAAGGIVARILIQTLTALGREADAAALRASAIQRLEGASEEWAYEVLNTLLTEEEQFERLQAAYRHEREE